MEGEKKRIFPIIMLMCGILLCACGKSGKGMEIEYAGDAGEKGQRGDTASADWEANIDWEENINWATNTDCEADTDGQIEKGYNLPIDARRREAAEKDCRERMGLISELYKNADKGGTSNVILSDEVINQMAEKLKNAGCPVTLTGIYSNMENYREVEEFLNASLGGSSGSSIVYKVHPDGGIGRYEYSYDGRDMYVLFARAAWSRENEPVTAYISNTRIREWSFTEKGWFCYQLCVPEYPEVPETMDGSCMVRVKPITEENREMSEKYVLGLAYQGNNLLCSDWDADHMEGLDYNGVYEYLHAMKYQEPFPWEDYPDGIPHDAFERLIMEYLPVTAEEIQAYAVFDQERQTYEWERLGCLAYSVISTRTILTKALSAADSIS